MNRKSSKSGAILIEFAFSIPVLILLIFYLHDLAQLAQIETKVKLCGMQMINMIQNVSLRRENTAITRQDYANICSAAFLTYFGSDQKIYSNSNKNR